MTAPEPTPPPLPEPTDARESSVLGIVSLALSIGAAVLMTAIIALAGYLGLKGHPSRTPAGKIASLVLLLTVGLDLAALVVGFLSLFQKNTTKVHGAIGLAISTAMILFVGIVVLIALAAQQRILHPTGP